MWSASMRVTGAPRLCARSWGPGVAIASFQKHAQTLEDYYLKMTGEGN